MTISVTRNSNGTLTITCGSETVTLGSSPSLDAVPQPTRASDEPPVLWPNDQHTASIIATGKAKIEIVSVRSVDDLQNEIRKVHALHSETQKPTIFQFDVNSDKPLQIRGVNKVVSDLGYPEWMGMQIKLTGPRDE